VRARHPRPPRELRPHARLSVAARPPPPALPLPRRLPRVEDQPTRESEASIWIELAEVERGAGHTQSARKALRRALARDPRAVRGWIALGEVEAELDRTRQALAAWRRVPEVDRRAGPLVYPRIAASFAALGSARDHETYLRELLAADPDDPGARLALARALAARGAVEDALLCAREVLEQGRGRLEAHVTLGRILLAEGRDAEVAKAHAALLDLLEREHVTLPGDGEALG
jgi:lipopolysaccharide biosynthesis regulator YciM